MQIFTRLGPGVVSLMMLVSLAAAVAQQEAASGDRAEEPARNVDAYNLPKTRVALKGYDPVAYFPEGGGKAQKGAESISIDHKGVIYRFASEENRERFRANPAKYEPAYGGWCAWAMADGDRADINPKSFIVQDGRLLVFYDAWLGDTRAQWQKGDHKELERRADEAWREQSGEAPRGEHRPSGEE